MTLQETKREEMRNIKDTQKVLSNSEKVDRLWFGVDSKTRSDDLLQNNIDLFEWVKRNKVYPAFWGRNIVGEDVLTKEEIDFLHHKACKIAPICNSADPKKTDEQGEILGERVSGAAHELGIPAQTAIFVELDALEDANRNFMRGFARALLEAGYTPGFKANTDAKYKFDLEFSRGMQTDPSVFAECLIWATAPTLAEYDRITTTHLISPEVWKPFAPSAITRRDIAIWQYGRDCHPIENDMGKEVTFDVNLIKKETKILEKMF